LSYDVATASSAQRLSARSDVDERTVDRHVDQPSGVHNEERDAALMKLAAKARIVEALASGDLRVLATELRGGLEALAGPSALIVPLVRRKG
jgi:hypothetical protein